MDQFPLDAPPREHQPDLLPDEPPRWPTVVGVISIVWGSLGIICGGCGLASPLIMEAMLAQQASQQGMGPMPDIMKPGPLQMALGVVGLLWTVLLLVAGIMLTLRKPVARPLHLVYAVVNIILTIVGTIMGIASQQAVREWATNNPDNEWAKQVLIQPEFAGYISIGLGAVIGLVWPVFCLIWFGAVKRSARDITGAPA